MRENINVFCRSRTQKLPKIRLKYIAYSSISRDSLARKNLAKKGDDSLESPA